MANLHSFLQVKMECPIPMILTMNWEFSHCNSRFSDIACCENILKYNLVALSTTA